MVTCGRLYGSHCLAINRFYLIWHKVTGYSMNRLWIPFHWLRSSNFSNFSMTSPAYLHAHVHAQSRHLALATVWVWTNASKSIACTHTHMSLQTHWCMLSLSLTYSHLYHTYLSDQWSLIDLIRWAALSALPGYSTVPSCKLSYPLLHILPLPTCI